MAGRTRMLRDSVGRLYTRRRKRQRRR